MIFIGAIFFFAMAVVAMREVQAAKSNFWVNFWVLVFGLMGCIGVVLIITGLNSTIK